MAKFNMICDSCTNKFIKLYNMRSCPFCGSFKIHKIEGWNAHKEKIIIKRF